MKTPTVLCDVDGVLADFVGGVCTWLKAHGLMMCPADFRGPIRNHLPGELCERLAQHVGFASSLEWYQDAIAFAAELKATTDCVVVTAPWTGATWAAERTAWLDRVFEPHDIIFAHGKQKHRVRGDILIEDTLATCIDWKMAHPEGKALLMDRPWNRALEGDIPKALLPTRVYTYEEILTHVRG